MSQEENGSKTKAIYQKMIDTKILEQKQRERDLNYTKTVRKLI